MEVRDLNARHNVAIATNSEGVQVGLIPLEDKVSLTSESGDIDSFISDGYHTFKELYDHRHMLYMALAKGHNSWKSLLHDDGTSLEGMFIAGIILPSGKSITYHLPLDLWDMCPGNELAYAPVWDGHTSNDVLLRIEDFINYS